MKTLSRVIRTIFRMINRKILHLERAFNKHRHGLRALIYLFLVLILIVLLLKNYWMIGELRHKIDGKPKVRIDWHDWKLIDEEESRTGIGEHGVGSFLWTYPPSTKQINDTHGYNGYLSDRIALNRSLKDLRPQE